mgnify:CR=1 FL=1
MTDTAPKHRMTFLNRLYARLRELLAERGDLTDRDFRDAVKVARGHAGGKAKADALAQLLAAESDPTGVAVVLPLPQDIAAELAVDGGLPADDLHLTIGMIGQRADMTDVQLAEALLAVRDAGICCAPLNATIGGIGRFMASPGSDAKDVVYLSVDSPALIELRDEVEDALEARGLELMADHGFTPHITLAYIDPGAAMPLDAIEPQQVTFMTLALWAGPQRSVVALIGAAEQDEGMAGLGAALGVGPDGKLMPIPQAPEQDVEGTPYEYLASETSAFTFSALAFADAPEWIPYLPKPGSYAHPRYGNIALPAERIARFVQNFNAGVYQKQIPIDAEHETKLSGAAGWITKMRQNADGSADAKVDWTERGKAFFADSRFRYFSPEWYDQWQRPETGETIADVAIGGALCTRPFFKAPALRPLFASEVGQLTDTTTTTIEGDTMDASQFAELEAKVKSLETENAALKQAGEQSDAASKALAERLAAVEQERQTERFRSLIKNDGARWFGEDAAHLGILGTLAKTFGEQSPEFAAYVAQQQQVATALRQSAAFGEIGGDGAGRAESNHDKLDRMARERATVKGMPFEQAYSEILIENPALYSA